MKWKDCWFLYLIIAILILGIFLFRFIPQITDTNDVSLVLAFVGILATFIVVGNYAQVKDIEKKFDDKVKDIDKKTSGQDNKIENISNTINLEINAIKKDIQNTTNKAMSTSNLYTARTFRDSEPPNIILAFYYYKQSLVFASLMYEIDSDLINRIIRELRILLKKPDGSGNIEPFVTLINIREEHLFQEAIKRIKGINEIKLEWIEIIENFNKSVIEKCLPKNKQFE